MSASLLPFEIISIIANLLPLKEKLCCTTVCRTWKTPFQESLWTAMDIFGRRKLESICDTTSSSNIYQTSGYRVQTLSLAWRLGVNDEQLHAFQQLFPNIKQLHIRQGSLSKENFGKSTDWNLWRFLTHLNVSLSWLGLEDEPKELVRILSFLPHLNRLEYSDAAMDQKRLYTWENIEAIHAHLPHLSYLSMAVYLDVISERDLSRIANIEHTNALTSLRLCVDNMDLWWIYYFAQKYLGIHSLELRVDTEYFRPKDYLETAKPVFSTLTKAFPNLKTVLFSSRPNVELSQKVLWDLFGRVSVSLKKLTHEVGCNDLPKALLTQSAIESIRSCSTTLETLLISSPVDLSDKFGVQNALGSCRCLVDLHIMNYNLPLAFNTLLDSCVNVKRLTLNVEAICEPASSSSFTETVTKLHGLQMLDISRATINAELFGYISRRCKHLKYMRLADINVIGQPSENTGNICLDMTSTRFDYLELNRVLFYGSAKKWGPENIINMMVLAQKNNISLSGQSLEDSLPKERIIVPSEESVWLHLNQTPTSFPWMQRWRVLKSNEIKVACKYFWDFQGNSGINKGYSGTSHTDVERSDMGQVSWYNWKQDLPRGYALLCCKVANKYEINTCRYPDNNSWESLYRYLK